MVGGADLCAVDGVLGEVERPGWVRCGGPPSFPLMTMRVSALPLDLLSLSNAFEGEAMSNDGAARRLATGRAHEYGDLAAALSHSARGIGGSVARVASALSAADSSVGAALAVPPDPRSNSLWSNELARTFSTPDDHINDVLRTAASQIGVRERGTNRTAYGKWWGADGVLWCAEFVSWTFAMAGHPLPVNFSSVPGASGFAYCQYGRDEAYKRGELFDRPRPGDIFFRFKRGDSGPGHTGIVVDVLPDGAIVTIEGNAGAGSRRDGGGVVKQTRPGSYASALTFWRVLPPASGDDRGAGDLAPTPSNLRTRMRRRKR